MKAYQGNNPYIFISYAHKDENKVYPLIEELQKYFNVWYDEGIAPGSEWDEYILSKLKGSAAVFFMVSENSLRSTNCMDEIAFARNNNYNFVNILIEDVELSDSFEFRYGRYQRFNAFRYPNISSAIKELDRKLEAHIFDRVRISTTPISTSVDVKNIKTSTKSKKEDFYTFKSAISQDVVYDNPRNICLGYSREDGSLIYGDVVNLGSALVAGKEGSGKTTFVQCTLATLCEKIHNNKLNAYIFSQNQQTEWSSFLSLPMVKGTIYNSLIDGLKFIADEIEERVKLLNDNGWQDAVQYNHNNPNNPLQTIFVVIDELDQFLISKEVNMETLFYVAKYGNFAGIILYATIDSMYSPVYTHKYLSEFDQIICLTCNETKESVNIIGEHYHDASKLKDGEAYLIRNTNNETTDFKEIYIPEIEYDEIENMIDDMLIECPPGDINS